MMCKRCDCSVPPMGAAALNMRNSAGPAAQQQIYTVLLRTQFVHVDCVMSASCCTTCKWQTHKPLYGHDQPRCTHEIATCISRAERRELTVSRGICAIFEVHKPIHDISAVRRHQRVQRRSLCNPAPLLCKTQHALWTLYGLEGWLPVTLSRKGSLALRNDASEVRIVFRVLVF